MNHEETTTPMLRARTLAELLLAAAVATAFLLAAMAARPAQADAAPAWESLTSWGPTVLEPGERGAVHLEIGNVGDQQATGWPTVEVQLPPGVTFDQADPAGLPVAGWTCSASGDPQTVTCANPFAPSIPSLLPLPYTYIGAFVPIYVEFTFDVASGAPVGDHELRVTLSGGGAVGDPVTTVHDVRIDDAPAGFGILEGTFATDVVDEAGADFTQAGGHPDEAVAEFATTKAFRDPAVTGDWVQVVVPDQSFKDVVTEIPPGFAGNPLATPTCAAHLIHDDACPPSTQVGYAQAENLAAPQGQMTAIYNVTPPSDAPAHFMFNSGGGPVLLTPTVRSDGDWGLNISAKDVSEAAPVYSTRVVLWGNPSDPSHDLQRCAILSHVGDICPGYNAAGGSGGPGLHDPHVSTMPPGALLTNPTRCTGTPDITTIRLAPWTDPAPFEPDGDPDLTPPTSWFSDTASAPPLTGCEALIFTPSIDVKPTASRPGAPSGLEFELTLPQNDDPEGLATAHMRNATVTLPAGTTVNPATADGLASCSSSQIGLTSKDPVRFTKLEPSCPLASKIGTVTVETPLLADPLHGDVFLAAQGDHPFDSLAAIYMVIRGPGILGKVAGKVRMDPDSGRITTTVVDNPQVPFDTLTVRLKSGERAPLTLPGECGAHEVAAGFTSWAGHDVSVSDDFAVDCPGTGGGFDPAFAAGTSNPIAGGSSPMRMRVVRDAGKELGRINMDLPRGLLAGPRDVAVCTDAQLQSGAPKTGRELQVVPSCPVGSQIGTTTVGVGAGVSPFFPLIPGTAATGRVFLTGTHHGSDAPAPAGMGKVAYGAAIEVPAVAGPFDLGRVVVRAAIYADPTTADLRVVSDKLPRVLNIQSGTDVSSIDGVVLNARDVRVDVDRANFVRNPTSCAEKVFAADIHAQDGTTVTRSSRFQVSDCAALAFKPKLALRLTGRKQRTTGKHPGVRAKVTQTAGEAGIEGAVVRLPKSLALDPDNAQALCEFVDGTKPDLENHCPKGSIVGRARAVSPLLKAPVAGNVYFVKNVRIDPRTGNQIRTLPMIVVALRGEIAVNLRGLSSTTRGGQLVNTFNQVPDAPISQFNLNIKGGKTGILTVTRTRASRINLCKAPRSHKADVDMDGHNGKRRDFTTTVKTPCAKKKKAAKRKTAAKRRAAVQRQRD